MNGFFPSVLLYHYLFAKLPMTRLTNETKAQKASLRIEKVKMIDFFASV
ncbi:MAG: hypothetical protein LAT83_04950 [Kiritimatiellae bacterium]|nr:hypothetical protein [Kiritimatiellia bacterium]